MRSEPYRFACPEGHRSVRKQQNGRWECKTCWTSYPADQIIDLKLEAPA